MDIVIWIELLIFTLLLGFSGFFSGSETALFSLNRTQLEQMTHDALPQEGRIRRLLNEPRRLIVTILIGNELVNVSASVISASLVIHFLGGAEKWWVNIFIMLPILLLVGEITPKTIAVKRNVAFASAVARPLEIFAALITPLRLVVRYVADGLTTLLIGKARSQGNIVTEDMVRTLAVQAEEEGVLDQTERKFIDNIFDFGNLTVLDLMSPRSTLVSLDVDAPTEALETLLQTTPLTRLPVFQGDHDNVIGILHMRDLLDPEIDLTHLDSDRLRGMLRDPMKTPGTLPASKLFFRFRKERRSIALVIDEFGGVLGLITMDDLMEAIFGSLRPIPNLSVTNGESGVSEPGMTIPGSLPVSVFNQQCGAELPLDRAETLGGLILHLNGELPEEGLIITCEGWEFRVESVRNNRIDALWRPMPNESDAAALDEPEAQPRRAPVPLEGKAAESLSGA